MQTRLVPPGRLLLPTCLIFSALLWAVYWFQYFPSWTIFLHSDHAVPYIMTLTPWLKQDFFYWSAERFGAVYSVAWKVLGRYLFGSEAKPFYAVFPGFFFLGTAFWLAAIRDWARAACFLVIMMPFTFERIDQFLFPGHVYGTLYCFLGISSYLLLKEERLTHRDAVLLGVLSALAHWQHLLVGLILSFLVGLKYWSLRTEHSRSLWRESRPYWVTWVSCLIPIEVARGWATRWGRPVYSHLETWGGFVENMRDFSSRGFTFELGNQFGLALAVVLVVATPLGLWAASQRRRDYRSLFVAASLLIALACVILFNFHHHYTENSRHERYFSFVVPMVVFALTQLPLASPTVLNRIFVIVSLSALLSLTVQRVFFDRRESIFDPASVLAKGRGYAEGAAIVDGLVRAGCTGVLDNYWRAYRLTGISDGKLPATAVDHIRNPIYFDGIYASKNVCIADQFYTDRVKPLTQTHNCAKVDFNYWLCRSKPR